MTQLDMFGETAVGTLPYVPPPSPPPVPTHKLVFVPGPVKHADIISAWSSLPHEIMTGYLKMVFDQEVTLTNRLRNEVAGTQHTVKLFQTVDGRLCHQTNPRSGHAFSSTDLAHLVSIEPAELDMVAKVKNLANRIHPNAWGDLRTQLLTDPEKVYDNYGYTVTNITRKFSDYVLKNIRRAFESKTAYTYDTRGGWSDKKTGRNLRVECKLCDNGIFRAWFTSEFPGCANGDYWLLVNPTTAICRERD